jgi:hypothetical protein
LFGSLGAASASTAAIAALLIAAASCSVNARRSPNSGERSIGVAVALVHTPCKSGVPSGIRGAR